MYIYFARPCYTEEHILYIIGLLNALEASKDIYTMNIHERTDLDSWEIEVEPANNWTRNFLQHMADCDMFLIASNRIEEEA